MNKDINLIYHLYAYYEIFNNSNFRQEHFKTYEELNNYEKKYSDSSLKVSELFKTIICAREKLNDNYLRIFNSRIKEPLLLKHYIYHLIGDLFNFRIQPQVLLNALKPLDNKNNVIETDIHPIIASSFLQHAKLFANDEFLQSFPRNEKESYLNLHQVLCLLNFGKEKNFVYGQEIQPTHYFDYSFSLNSSTLKDSDLKIEQYNKPYRLSVIVKKVVFESSYYNSFRNSLIANGWIESITAFTSPTMSSFYLLIINKKTYEDSLNIINAPIEINQIGNSKEIKTEYTTCKELIANPNILNTIWISKENRPKNGKALKDYNCEIFRGCQFASSYLEEIKANENDTNSLSILNIGDIENVTFDSSKLLKIKRDEKRLTRFILQHYDILVSARGSSIKVGIVLDEKNIVPSGSINVIRCDQNKLSPFYLLAYLMSEKGKNALLNLNSSAAIIAINASNLLNFEIEDIPLALQVHYKEKIIELINKIKEATDVLEKAKLELFNIIKEG